MAEQEVKFRKPNTNFKAILDRQRKEEEDEKFAISDALQEYIGKQTKDAGYLNEEKLQDAGIRQEVINFVDNYTISNLDGLKGADYDEALQTQKSTDKQIEEIFKLKEDQGGLNEAEKQYIRDTVQATNKKLGEILGVSTRLKLAFRDFKKELKPLKLAARLGINKIPIIGKRIDRAIRAEEEGEAEALRIKRGLRKRTARETRKAGDLDFAETQPESEIQQTKTQAKQVTSQILGIDQGTPTNELFADRETQVEQERESDKQFDTTSTILERILEESELTNELLKGAELDGKKGGFSLLEALGLAKLTSFIKAGKLGTIVKGLGALATTFGTLAAAVTAIFAIPAFGAFLNRPQGEEETKVMNEQSRDLTSSANNEGVLMEDIEAENNARLEGINKDEYNKLKNRGDLDENTTLDQYAAAKKEAGVGNRITSYFTGKIKDAKVEKIMSVLAGSTTTIEGDVTTNTDTSSITNNTEKKMDNVNQMNESGMNKSVNESSSTTNNINNNIQQNDNSQNTNKTEYGSSTIGTSNPDTLVKETSIIP